MNSLAILVPVKSSRVKSRLSGILSAPQRLEFSRLLLIGVLKTLTEADLLASTHVVSPDEGVLRLARGLGAGGIPEENDKGVNSAVLKGIKETGSPDTVFVIPSDLPLLRASDVQAALALKSLGLDVVVAPSWGFDGTNALAYSPSSGFALSYDNDSFWNHLASAAQKGLTTAVVCKPGFMLDVDSAEDFRRLSEARLARPSVKFARSLSR